MGNEKNQRYCNQMRFESIQWSKMRLRPRGSAPTTWGAYSAPPGPLAAVLRGRVGRGRERRGGEGKGKWGEGQGERGRGGGEEREFGWTNRAANWLRPALGPGLNIFDSTVVYCRIPQTKLRRYVYTVMFPVASPSKELTSSERKRSSLV